MFTYLSTKYKAWQEERKYRKETKDIAYNLFLKIDALNKEAKKHNLQTRQS